jgi:hypothetical protein
LSNVLRCQGRLRGFIAALILHPDELASLKDTHAHLIRELTETNVKLDALMEWKSVS